MRVISAVTLIFLPGTFMATLFSTSFWNFQPANQGSVVSKWLSLYFCSTLVLTLAVLAAWRYFSGRHMEKLKLGPGEELSALPEIDDTEEREA